MKSVHTYRFLFYAFILWMMPLSAVLAQESRSSLDTNSHIQNTNDKELDFSFFGNSLRAARMKTIHVESAGEYEVVQAWNKYKKVNGVDQVMTSLRSLSDELGLNDWFVFELVRFYTNELLRSGSPIDRVVLQHYLLVEMGYDVRLARTQKQLLLLVPFEQVVYEHDFVRADGKDYYLFYDDLDSFEEELSVIYPCDPSKKNLGKGQILNLSFEGKPLKMSSGENRSFELDDGRIHVVCSINDGVKEMLSNYPMMDLQCYTTQVVLPQFQQSLIEQLKPQIEDMTQCEAANALLHFVQYVFGYKNDCESHGHEKAYFIEENFYYDNNDCEDRSILYAFLVRSLLGLDVQIVEYPGHECTAVHFTDCLTYGNGYYYGSDFYLICDPSYVGAPIGRCMPKYRSAKPQVYISNKPTDHKNTNKSPLSPVLNKAIIMPDITIEFTESDKLS